MKTKRNPVGVIMEVEKIFGGVFLHQGPILALY